MRVQIWIALGSHSCLKWSVTIFLGMSSIMALYPPKTVLAMLTKSCASTMSFKDVRLLRLLCEGAIVDLVRHNVIKVTEGSRPKNRKG